MGSITAADVTAWLWKNPKWTPFTRRTYIGKLDLFFRYALKKGFTTSNPCSAVDRPEPANKPVLVLTVGEARLILETCQAHDPELLPYFAIALFAGLRPEEIKRLSPESIKTDWIEVQAAKSKTRRRRLVELHPTLALWLAVPRGKVGGWVHWRPRWNKIRALSGVTWSQDVLRHTFCSYAYPIKGAHWTSMHAGHSEQVLFAHYRELVTESAAREFWSIRP